MSIFQKIALLVFAGIFAVLAIICGVFFCVATSKPGTPLWIAIADALGLFASIGFMFLFGSYARPEKFKQESNYHFKVPQQQSIEYFRLPPNMRNKGW